MTIGHRHISTREMNILDFVRKLTQGAFLIPSFQREFVWDPEDIIKLWDSIYRFYPVGSILYWKTDISLHIHRKLGGWILPEDDRGVSRGEEERVYILDGQQRATSLLVSLLGRQTGIRGRSAFDGSLYFDAATATFFFAKAFERRRREVDERFLIPLGDLLESHSAFRASIDDRAGNDQAVRDNLLQLSRVFTDYNLSFICIRGFDIPAVREIFERINQEGKGLNSMDLMIARTFRNYEYMVEDDL
ncbi:MAG: DUF262 domain-containing protein [Deltaproteobacteria bacterium]|nr:DUF262 domain-containing protein [Deltaproteobacteria bacterium]